MDPSATCSRFLIAMKAFESAVEEGHTQLGEIDGNLAADLEILKPKAKAITDAFGGGALEDKYLQEFLLLTSDQQHKVTTVVALLCDNVNTFELVGNILAVGKYKQYCTTLVICNHSIKQVNSVNG